MKPKYPSLKSLRKGLKTVFFHPMFYGAILLHWAIIQSPLPPEKVEEPETEELLAESIPIASSSSLNNLTPKPKQKPKVEEKQEKPPKEDEVSKPKPEPKPLAKALAQEDPKLKERAEEKRKKELEAQKDKEEKKQEEEQEQEQEEEQKEEQEEEEKEQEQEEEQKEEKEEQEQEEEQEESKKYQGTGEAGAVGFNLRLLPQPDLVFTAESIQNYTDQIGSLEYQTNVETAEWMTQTISIDDAIQGVKAKPEYSTYSFDKILDDADNPFSTLYQLTQDGKDTIYISFIKSKKRTLRSSTVFVRWTRNPIES